ncbi:peroxisomal membrane protein PEX14-like [Antedon mediterranea]|uniref:peroxisomal membrane protein PEX14-like n=1 Tax=Antedon mediterranea TaxID=105859 RepID=UPI003AF6FE86
MSSDVKSPVPQMDNPLLPSENTSDIPREKLIETAIKFLQNPQVQSSAVSARKAFLVKKGLTDKEIEIAINRSGVNQVAPYNKVTPAVPVSQPIVSYRPQGWRGYTALGVVVGSLAYCIYKFYQNVIAPFLTRKREQVEALKAMQEAVKELGDSVAETVNEVQKMVDSMKVSLNKQDQKLDQLTLDVARNKTMETTVKSIDIGDIKSELVSLKGLVLSRNQFPRTPKPSPIPAWQMASSKPNGDTTSTTETPPANHVEQSVDSEQTSEAVLSETATDGQGKIARSLSGSFEGSLSPSKIVQGTYENGGMPINNHLVNGDNFSENHHDDSNKSDDSVD